MDDKATTREKPDLTILVPVGTPGNAGNAVSSLTFDATLSSPPGSSSFSGSSSATGGGCPAFTRSNRRRI